MMMTDKLREARLLLMYFEIMYDGVNRIIDLVQNNREFFGNPSDDSLVVDTAADKLEELVSEYNANAIITPTTPLEDIIERVEQVTGHRLAPVEGELEY